MLKRLISIGLCLLLCACSTDSAEVTDSVSADTPQVSFDMTEVALHSTEEDCWMVLRDKVYDFTDFLPKHPGGKKMIEGCGTDITDRMDPPADYDGLRHVPIPDSQIADYFIGILRQE